MSVLAEYDLLLILMLHTSCVNLIHHVEIVTQRPIHTPFGERHTERELHGEHFKAKHFYLLLFKFFFLVLFSPKSCVCDSQGNLYTHKYSHARACTHTLGTTQINPTNVYSKELLTGKK